MTNPMHRDADTEIEQNAAVGLDAMEAGQVARARELLVGMPATIGIGSDSYAADVVHVTRCTITVAERSDGEQRTFRRNKWGAWRSDSSYRLALGAAVDHRDPSF